MENPERIAAVEALGLTVESVFIPLSVSRNKGGKWQSLNWRVTLKRNGREVLSSDYSAGVAHSPAHIKAFKYPSDKKAAIAWEVEKGLEAIGRPDFGGGLRFDLKRGPQILPDILGVLASLTLDCSILDYPNFEAWAGDSGYDPDSRAGEKLYRDCLENALKMRAALGESGLTELQQIFQDY